MSRVVTSKVWRHRMGVAILRKWKKMHNTVDKRTHNDMRLTIATKPMISHELGDDPIIIAEQKRIL